ncbi:hypothetical protein [Microtetraspora glauca]|uniref:Integral membrane protein n=1 Tax=Microtetraspora glauca TaxID=1996 RepID=A0ABV3GQI5_MICGL
MNGVAGHRARIAWVASLMVNTVFGYFGTIPLGFVWIFLANYPLAAVGLTHRDPTDNDGIFPWLIVLSVVWGFIALWALVNIAIRRFSRLRARPYWTFSAVVALVPVVVFAMFPDVWAALRWY